jgi:EmrB/QacA subfamily drug resistance transporter
MATRDVWHTRRRSRSATSEDTPDTIGDAAVHPHSRQDRMLALTGTLLGLVLAALASTTVLTSLPVMMHELGGDQTAYTWVVGSTLLTTTVSLAIWGKLADLFSHKKLMFAAIAVFVVASLFAGLAPDTAVLIGFRSLQGIGAGGVIAVGPVLPADLLSPRERGRYAGLISGVIGIGTIGGPVIGGIVTDTIGWRWNFYLGVPFAIAAVVLLQRSLHLPVHHRPIRIDWVGAGLISVSACALMVWVTLAGSQFDWLSPTSYVVLGGAVVCALAAAVVEAKVREPVIPHALLRNPSISHVVIASTALGVTMLAVPTFMSQYLQIARGLSASVSGMFMLSMSVATFLAASVVGHRISRTGLWKRWVVLASVALVCGLAGLSTLTVSSGLAAVSVYLLCIGFAIGVLMHNLLVVAQNCAPPHQLGAASALPAFFRQLASAMSVSILGAVLATRISAFHTAGDESELVNASVPRVGDLAEPLRGQLQTAYADGIGDLFLLCTPLGLLGLVAALVLPNTPLSSKTAVETQALDPLDT